MALTLTDQYDIVFPAFDTSGRIIHSNLEKQVFMSLVSHALDILFVEGIGVTNHADRVTWAKLVLISPQREVQKFLLATLNDSTIHALDTTSVTTVSETSVLTITAGLIEGLRTIGTI